MDFKKWLAESGAEDEHDAILGSIYDPNPEGDFTPDSPVHRGIYGDYLEDQGGNEELVKLIRWRDAAEGDPQAFCQMAADEKLTPSVLNATLRQYLTKLKGKVAISKWNSDDNGLGIYVSSGANPKHTSMSLSLVVNPNRDGKSFRIDFDTHSEKVNIKWISPHPGVGRVDLTRGQLHMVPSIVKQVAQAVWSFSRTLNMLIRCNGMNLVQQGWHQDIPSFATHWVAAYYENGTWHGVPMGQVENAGMSATAKAQRAALNAGKLAAATVEYNQSNNTFNYHWNGILRLPDSFETVVERARITRATERDWVYREFRFGLPMNNYGSWTRGEISLSTSDFRKSHKIRQSVIEKLLAAYDVAAPFSSLNLGGLPANEQERIIDEFYGHRM